MLYFIEKIQAGWKKIGALFGRRRLIFLAGVCAAIFLAAGYFLFFDRDRAREARADYLRVTETAAYFHVQSGTYGIRVYKTDSDSFVNFYNENGVEIGIQSEQYQPVSTAYNARLDTNRSVALIENSPIRAVIKMSGKYDQTYGAPSDYLTDGTNPITYTAYYYIYPEYFTYKKEVNAFNGISLRENYTGGAQIFVVRQNNEYFDSGKRQIGTTTSESTAGNYSIHTAKDYAAVLATSTVDWQVVKLSEQHSGTSTFAFSFGTEINYQTLHAIWHNGNLKGTSTAVFAVRPQMGTTAEERRA